MRVLIISNLFPPGFVGGYELGALEMARGLRENGHDVRVLTSDYFLDDEGDIADLTVLRTLSCVEPARVAEPRLEQCRRSYLVNPRNLRRVGSELIAFRPEAVMSFNTIGLGAFGLAQFLVAIGMVPVMYLMDDVFSGLRLTPDETTLAQRIFGDAWFAETAEFIIMSANLRAQVEESLGHRLRNVTTVPGWAATRSADLRHHSTADSSDGIVRFVYSSRVAPHKGIDVALAAVRRLVDAGQTNLLLDIFGTGEVAWLLQHLAAQGFTEQVRYRGLLTKAEMMQRFAEYDALLFPTWEREPFGFVVSEAALAGCIPVMTAGIGAAEWFFDGIDCLKICRDAMDLATAMLRLALMQPAERLAMRRHCRETATRFLNFPNALRRVEDVLMRSATLSQPVSPVRVRGAEAAMTLLDDIWRPSQSA
jgi:glycosyltransferase involved in cell wall biosynthesis